MHPFLRSTTICSAPTQSPCHRPPPNLRPTHTSLTCSCSCKRDATFQPYQSIASESISFNSRLSDSPARKSPAVVMMRSSCADVPDEIKRRRLPLASERSTLAMVFPPAAPLTLITEGMIRFTIGCHATISATFLPVLPPTIVVCAPPKFILCHAIMTRTPSAPRLYLPNSEPTSSPP